MQFWESTSVFNSRSFAAKNMEVGAISVVSMLLSRASEASELNCFSGSSLIKCLQKSKSTSRKICKAFNISPPAATALQKCTFSLRSLNEFQSAQPNSMQITIISINEKWKENTRNKVKSKYKRKQSPWITRPICTALSKCLCLSIRLKTCHAVSLQQHRRDCQVLKQKKALGFQALTKKFNYAHSKNKHGAIRSCLPGKFLALEANKSFPVTPGKALFLKRTWYFSSFYRHMDYRRSLLFSAS